ncbi:uroporphyrinogen decarboxylase family protein [Chloroflexota bacterium]
MSEHTGPDFERVRTALLLQGEPDRVPLAEIGAHPAIKKAVLGRSVISPADDVDFWVKAGYDFVAWPVGMVSVLMIPDPQRRGRVPSIAKDIHRAAKAKYSVLDDQEAEKLWAEEGKGVITTLEELESFNWPTADDFDYSVLEAVANCLPQGMKIIPFTIGYFAPAYFLMGAETVFMSLYDDPGLVEKVMEKVGNIELGILERLMKYDFVGAVWITDDIAYSDNLMISPKHLRRYLFPWFKRATEICRKNGRPVIYHSDGKLYDVLGDLIDCGFNAIHAIEPKAMDIVYLKKTVGDRLCLIGNIDLAYTLTLGKPEEVIEETKQRLRDVAPGGGYCVSSSNSIPEYVPIANYNAMRETVLKYGTYPISI